MSIHNDDYDLNESLLFLLVSKEEKIFTQTKPYDIKKNVFIPDDKEGYIPALIQSVDLKSKTTTVKTQRGGVIILFSFIIVC
jgi:hypothetical protein